MSTDPFSASIIPFEVPESMRAFAEKGVSQARDSYAKFKDKLTQYKSQLKAAESPKDAKALIEKFNLTD